MIKTNQHALEVQRARVTAGKRGYAKAVRRFLRRTADDYQKKLKDLPVVWKRPEEKAAHE